MNTINLLNQQDEEVNVGLLDQIVTASLLEEKNRTSADQFEEEEGDDDSDGEVFEDGDESEREEEQEEEERDSNKGHESVAAVLTELSHSTFSNGQGGPSSISASNSQGPQGTHNSSTLSTLSTASSRPVINPNMAATISSINALLQSHLHGQQPHKVRLSGPIRANVNIRHGVWAPRLRCRKRKNLHAKDGIWIHPTCTLDHLINLVKGVLPDEFDWDAQASPLRYQAVNDQSLQSLKTVSGTVSTGQSLYSAFDLVRNRRSDGDNFILQLYVYGTWTVLLKPHLSLSANAAAAAAEDEHNQHVNHVVMQPPPKKKYQQAHYNQQQMQLTLNSADESSTQITPHGIFSHMRLSPPSSASSSASSVSQIHPPFINVAHTNHANTHPLAANPPVTYVPTVTLEMKLNGTFLPVEISRRSFISAIRACSQPKTPIKEEAVVNGFTNTCSTTNTSNTCSTNNTSTCTNSTNNPVSSMTTPPPSEA